MYNKRNWTRQSRILKKKERKERERKRHYTKENQKYFISTRMPLSPEPRARTSPIMHFLPASIFENPWYSIFPHKGNILLLMIFTLSFESKSFKLKLSCTDIRMSSCGRIQFSFIGESPLWNLRYLRRILRINIQVPKVVYISYGKSFNYIFVHYSPIQNRLDRI